MSAFAWAITLAGLVTACGGEAVPGFEVTSQGDPLQVALLTSGPVSDAGLYAGDYQGLLMIEDSLWWCWVAGTRWACFSQRSSSERRLLYSP